MADENQADLDAILANVDYPVSLADLVAAAESSGVDAVMLASLRNLPNQQYESPEDVELALQEQIAPEDEENGAEL